jgi:hypothetical protein
MRYLIILITLWLTACSTVQTPTAPCTEQAGMFNHRVKINHW